MDGHVELEAQIGRWRGYLQRRQAIAPADLDELEDHLRGEIAARRSTGLDDDEAFLVAIKRMGNLDAVSREFAREHSDRLWKQLVLVPEERDGESGKGWRELIVVLCLAVGAGLAVKAGILLFGQESVLARNIGLLVIPFPTAYFAWKRRLAARTAGTLLLALAVLAVLLNAYPVVAGGSTELLAIVHAPVLLWMLAGIAYAGGRWRSDGRRMDFVRFTGEIAIYFTLLALGGAVLIGLTFAVLQLVDLDLEPVMEAWILPFAVPGALVVAAWLVEAKQNVVENIAPVLTKVFTPLTLLMLLSMLAVLAASGGPGQVGRELLILMDAILVLVLCLLLYAVSARDSLSPPGLFDGIQLLLVLASIAVDVVMLVAMLSRIAEFGTSPNKIAALGLNLLLLVHLLRSAWLGVGFLRRRRLFAELERWQTRYLPAYGLWALAVVALFPPVFGFR
ncbi:MAG TPA: permease prefix domain 1-containing protein [Arthrobacter sp.]|nr:permease prefix domain 1-containing protein [Arthrobacter sp.]